jgi:multisubunit Na+/H+ antiporter MnhG subunit
MDRLVRKSEKVGWAVLVIFALLFPWFGLEPPARYLEGTGLVTLDVIVVACLLAAVVAQIARIVEAPGEENAYVRMASYMLLIAISIVAGRFLWILATIGDVSMPTTIAVAFLFLSLSVLLHAVGRVIYGEHHANP